jgi:hypothetical protein
MTNPSANLQTESSHQAQPSPPAIAYWQVWTDQDGISHQSRCQIRDFTLKRVEMGVGEISFGEDQNTKANAQGQKGHLSGTVGDVPAVLMLVQLQETPTIAQACRFR